MRKGERDECLSFTTHEDQATPIITIFSILRLILREMVMMRPRIGSHGRHQKQGISPCRQMMMMSSWPLCHHHPQKQEQSQSIVWSRAPQISTFLSSFLPSLSESGQVCYNWILNGFEGQPSRTSSLQRRGRVSGDTWRWESIACRVVQLSSL